VQYEIFLSHSSDDTEWATRLYGRLRRFRVSGQPLRVFLAEAAIGPGESIPKALSEALEDSRHLVMVMSPSWLASEWCRLENEVSAWRDPSADRRVLVPLLYKGCNIPAFLRRLQYIDFREPSAFHGGLRQIVYTVRTNVHRSAGEELAGRARQAVLNEPILPWLGFGGPSFDFLWPEMIIDPLVRLRKHPGRERRLSDWIEDQTGMGASSIAIVGEPGVGKTTALRTILLSGGGLLPQDRVLLHARDLTDRLGALLERSEASGHAIGVIVDGLDEVGAEHMSAVGSALAELRRPNLTVIVASRTEFFDRQYDLLQSALANLVEILELISWSHDDILGFTESYSSRIDAPHLRDSVEQILSQVPNASAMLGNAMRLTLLLYLLATGAQIDLLSLQEPYRLYETFYSEWIKKERSRGTGGLNAGVIKGAHTALARWLYENKGEVSDLAELMEFLRIEVADELASDSAFSGLLTLSEGLSGHPRLVSFRHETLGEYLIAHDILKAFNGTADVMASGLRVTVGDDVNTFVRSGMLVASKAIVRRYLSNLTGRYDEFRPGLQLMTGPLGADQAERLREQVLYYIGRLPLDSFPEILRSAFHGESAPLLRRAAALGAIITGDLIIERRYMELLGDPREALLNRSVQMVYFADVQGDLHSFEDSGQDWSKTRAAIYRRLAATSLRDIRLRWWDLRTLRSFYNSRQYADQLTESEAAALTTLSVEDASSVERTDALREELRLLQQELGLPPGSTT
jgi:hypothetical protein